MGRFFGNHTSGDAVIQDVLHIPCVTITIDQRPGGWHATVEWPSSRVGQTTEIYGEQTVEQLADAIRDVLLMGLEA